MSTNDDEITPEEARNALLQHAKRVFVRDELRPDGAIVTLSIYDKVKRSYDLPNVSVTI